MALTPDQIDKVAELARLTINHEESQRFSQQLNGILSLVAQMDAIDTASIKPLAHPLEMVQRVRPDEVTEGNKREKFQQIAPHVVSGLYLVPKVIDEV